MRYDQLNLLIDAHKPGRIVEVGTWNGHRALLMVQRALKHKPEVHYIGFDLFEQATEATDKLELNVKKHFTADSVRKKFKAFKVDNPGFTYEVHPGDTKKTLKPGKVKADLAFIDGGHSIETIANDYEALKHIKVVVLDDFYEQENGHPDIERHGCNKLIANNETALVMPEADPVAGGGKVRMVLIPKKAWPGPINLIIKTRNCVPDKNIQANVRYGATLIDKWVVECKPHELIGVICSGGPSLQNDIDKLKVAHADPSKRLFCVKSSHDLLIKNDIIPWGCLLLDPRAHVIDFIEHPHPDIRYFVATMCHPSTLDRLMEAGAKIYGYNAHVGSGEQDALKDFVPKKTTQSWAILIAGGSTAAIRGVSVLHALGFKRFELYGFDSCYKEKPVRTHGLKEKESFQVTVSGVTFWSDAELIAQAQDFDKLVSQHEPLGIDMEVYGEGIIPHIWNLRRKIRPSFGDVFA